MAPPEKGTKTGDGHDHDHDHDHQMMAPMKKQSNNATDEIPVTILTGFLGSGKTTLLNRLLQDTSHGLKFAIIENELGDVGVDDAILKGTAASGATKKETVEEELIEIVNGCICCTVRGDLMAALERLHAQHQKHWTDLQSSLFDAVIIETTGLADPAPVVQTFFIEPSIRKKYRLDAVLTVVDAKHILERLDEEKPDGVVNEALQQILFADKILLNKMDLIITGDNNNNSSGDDDDEEEKQEEKKSASADTETKSNTNNAQLEAIQARIRKIHPTAKLITCQHGNVDPQELVHLSAFELDRICELVPDFLEDEFLEFNEKHDNAISSVACNLPGELSLALLEQWIQKLLGGAEETGTTLYRYKGVLAVKGKDQKYIFQGVGMLFAGTFSDDLSWKPNEERSSRFVFIGKNLDTELLKLGFDACRVEEGDLRFAVGTAVTVNGGPEGWLTGTITRHWDAGNAYRVKLDANQLGGEEIWCALDTDELVRARPKKFTTKKKGKKARTKS